MPAVTGTETTKLIVLRGNSGAGKSTVARLVRARLRPGPVDPARHYYRNGVALVEQDYLRRNLLGDYDRPGATNIRLIELVTRTALDAGFDVVMEGMLFADRYADMLTSLTDDHVGRSDHWYFTASLAETQRRHLTRPAATQVSVSDLAEWYRPEDYLPDLAQRVVPSEWSADHAADHIVETALQE